MHVGVRIGVHEYVQAHVQARTHALHGATLCMSSPRCVARVQARAPARVRVFAHCVRARACKGYASGAACLDACPVVA